MLSVSCAAALADDGSWLEDPRTPSLISSLSIGCYLGLGDITSQFRC